MTDHNDDITTIRAALQALYFGDPNPSNSVSYGIAALDRVADSLAQKDAENERLRSSEREACANTELCDRIERERDEARAENERLRTERDALDRLRQAWDTLNGTVRGAAPSPEWAWVQTARGAWAALAATQNPPTDPGRTLDDAAVFWHGKDMLLKHGLLNEEPTAELNDSEAAAEEATWD